MKVRYVGTSRRRLVVFDDGREQMVSREDPDFGGKGTVIELPDGVAERFIKSRDWEKDAGGGGPLKSSFSKEKAPNAGKEE